MKNVGVTRKIDRMGRITFPKEMRALLDLHLGDNFELFVIDGENILLRKHYEKCAICESRDNLLEYKDKFVCRTCVDTFKIM